MNNRTTSWDSLGNKTSTNKLSQALKDLDLDYKVIKLPCAGVREDGDPVLFKDRVITVREDTMEPIGIVSDKYKVIQNDVALSFVEDIDNINIVAGGNTSWKSVWMIGELPEVSILGDSVKPNLIFQTSHDGSTPLKATICMLRIACQNQFTHAFKNSPCTVKIHHRGDTDTKVRAASDVLRRVEDYVSTYKSLAEDLSTKKVTPKMFDSILEKFFSIPEEASKRTILKAEEDRYDFLSAYNSDDNSNLRGTRWGVINAYTDYLTHKRVKNPENLFYQTINGYNRLPELIDRMAPDFED